MLSPESVTIANKAKEMMTCSSGGSNRVTVVGRVPETQSGHVAGDGAGPGRIAEMGLPSLWLLTELGLS